MNAVDLGLTPTALYFYDDFNFGMFTVEFDPQNFMGFSGPTMFSGSLSAPVMLAGIFVDDNSATSSGDGVFVADVNRQSLDGSFVYVVPEPSTIVLASFGMAWLLLRVKGACK